MSYLKLAWSNVWSFTSIWWYLHIKPKKLKTDVQLHIHVPTTHEQPKFILLHYHRNNCRAHLQGNNHWVGVTLYMLGVGVRPCHLLQLGNLFVQTLYVLVNNVGQLLNLHWLIIKQGLLFGHLKINIKVHGSHCSCEK